MEKYSILKRSEIESNRCGWQIGGFRGAGPSPNGPCVNVCVLTYGCKNERLSVRQA